MNNKRAVKAGRPPELKESSSTEPDESVSEHHSQKIFDHTRAPKKSIWNSLEATKIAVQLTTSLSAILASVAIAYVGYQVKEADKAEALRASQLQLQREAEQRKAADAAAVREKNLAAVRASQAQEEQRRLEEERSEVERRRQAESDDQRKYEARLEAFKELSKAVLKRRSALNTYIETLWRAQRGPVFDRDVAEAAITNYRAAGSGWDETVDINVVIFRRYLPAPIADELRVSLEQLGRAFDQVSKCSMDARDDDPTGNWTGPYLECAREPINLANRCSHVLVEELSVFTLKGTTEDRAFAPGELLYGCDALPRRR